MYARRLIILVYSFLCLISTRILFVFICDTKATGDAKQERESTYFGNYNPGTVRKIVTNRTFPDRFTRITNFFNTKSGGIRK